MSRRIDAQSGHFTTNVEHKDADVLASMYSLVLYLALDVNGMYRFTTYRNSHPPDSSLSKTAAGTLHHDSLVP